MTRNEWMDAVLVSSDIDQQTKALGARLRYSLPDYVGTPQLTTRGVYCLASQWMPDPPARARPKAAPA